MTTETHPKFNRLDLVARKGTLVQGMVLGCFKDYNHKWYSVVRTSRESLFIVDEDELVYFDNTVGYVETSNTKPQLPLKTPKYD